MHLGIKGKQVLGVTTIVGASVVLLSLLNLSKLASVSLDESRASAELVANAIYHRAYDLVGTSGKPYEALKNDPGLRSILESSLYSKNVTYAAIVDTNGIAVAHSEQSLEGRSLPPGGDLDRLLANRSLSQLFAIYSGQGRNLERRLPLLLGNTEFGSIRIGVSTLLIRQDLDESLGAAAETAFAALAISVIVSMLFAQLLLRPIHVIRSGLTRLGRGEFGVRLDLNQKDEFGELGTFFNTVSAQLSADRSQLAGQMANLESAVEHLEDAVAIVSPGGGLLFANPAMRALLPNASPGVSFNETLAGDHPLRRLSEDTLVSRQSRGPLAAAFGDNGERLVMTHAISDPKGDLVGIMLIARNLEYLSQVQSTVRYSRKLAALGRLSAGVAHEVKNPLNAMMIHLELLRQQFAVKKFPARLAAVAGGGGASGVVPGSGGSVTAAAAVDSAQALQHVDVIANEIRRLDEVVQGFLKFTRPEDLKLQPVRVATLLNEVAPIARSEAARTKVEIVIDCDGAPDVNGDPTMLRQAFLNLVLNACQAMPHGGTLRIRAESVRGHRVSISFTDTGLGIRPEYLQKIFDLYFTTKEKGSGIGLSMVYRTVQMHDGEIEVQSTPGAGTTFRILLPQASGDGAPRLA
ncbi:MAG TPA: ATP-binding protein [Vicinamibacterales bacterium]|nr:ATP-binding protein [Vicinamibacterales bacterium]